jgi:hypothetical protein
MKSMKLENIPMEGPQQRKAFIRDNESGVYEAINADGEQVYIFLEKGMCMTIKRRDKEKPMWFRCVDYDGEGYSECDYVEPAE